MLRIYTDGSCTIRDLTGGWAFVCYYPDGTRRSMSGGERPTTNNRMELMAAIKAAAFVPAGQKATIFSDSKYVVLGITEWSLNWSRKGWQIPNGDLWKILWDDTREKTIKWEWVRGHSGVPGNEEADRLATAARQRYKEDHP